MRYWLCCLLFLLLNSFAIAHPHAFIDMQNQFLIEQNRLVGIRMQWLMDEISSSEVIYEIESSKNKEKTVKQLTAEIMQNIVNQHYFAYFYDQNRQPIPYTKQPQNSELHVVNKHQLQIKFDVMLSKPRDLTQQQATLLIYDPTYYIAMLYPDKNSMTFSQATQCQLQIVEPEPNKAMQNYAASLDKNAEEDTSLGVLFAQKVTLLCP